MMLIIKHFYYKSKDAILNSNVNLNDIAKLDVKEQIGRFKYIEENKIKEEYRSILEKINLELENLSKRSWICGY